MFKSCEVIEIEYDCKDIGIPTKGLLKRDLFAVYEEGV